MKNAILNFAMKIQFLIRHEDGQDLVEYALITGLVAVAAVACLGNVASAISTIFTNVTSTLTAA
jgi:pilus assembly protein Flp/PilA